MPRSPHHPGYFLSQFLSEHNITQSKLANHIHIHVGVINQICNEKRGISPRMSILFAKALGTTEQFWLNLNMAYELGQESPPSRQIKPLVKAA